MSDVVVKVKRWENGFLGFSIWSIKVRGEYYFFGREVAQELGYTDPRKTIQSRVVDPEEKKSMEEVLGPNYRRILERSLEKGLESKEDKASSSDFIQRLHKDQKLLTEFSLYYFCATSKLDRAKPFQKWIFNTIKKIRETGTYTLPCGPVENPLNLVAKVSNLEKEIKTLRREIKTCDKATQTLKSVVVLDGSFKDLEERIIKTLKKNKSSLKRAIKQVELDLEKSIQEVKLDTRRTSSSSSSSNSHCLYYSSDSE